MMSSMTWAWIFGAISLFSFIASFAYVSVVHRIPLLIRKEWWSGSLRMLIGGILMGVWIFAGLSVPMYSNGTKIWHIQLGLEEPPWVIAAREQKEKEERIEREMPEETQELKMESEQAEALSIARAKWYYAVYREKGKEEITKAKSEYLKLKGDK